MSSTRPTAAARGGVPHAPESGRHPPPARAPRALAPDEPDAWPGWAVDTPSREQAPRRWLLVTSVVPWVVFAGLMVTRAEGSATLPPATPTSAPSAPTAATPDVDTDTPTPVADPTRNAPAPPLTTSPPVRPAATSRASVDARADAIAVGAAVVRLWLSTQPAARTVDGMGSAPGADGQYVEHVVVEHVDHPAGDLAVVTVLAITLPVADAGFGAPALVRVAVPVRMQPSATTIAGAPWLLPAPDLRVVPLVAQPNAGDDDLDLAADAAVALVRAGYRDVEIRDLAATDSWALLATAVAIAPGTTTALEQTVLLRHELGGLVVAGHAAPPASAAVPNPTATEDRP